MKERKKTSFARARIRLFYKSLRISFFYFSFYVKYGYKLMWDSLIPIVKQWHQFREKIKWLVAIFFLLLLLIHVYPRQDFFYDDEMKDYEDIKRANMCIDRNSDIVLFVFFSLSTGNKWLWFHQPLFVLFIRMENPLNKSENEQLWWSFDYYVSFLFTSEWNHQYDKWW